MKGLCQSTSGIFQLHPVTCSVPKGPGKCADKAKKGARQETRLIRIWKCCLDVSEATFEFLFAFGARRFGLVSVERCTRVLWNYWISLLVLDFLMKLERRRISSVELIESLEEFILWS